MAGRPAPDIRHARADAKRLPHLLPLVAAIPHGDAPLVPVDPLARCLVLDLVLHGNKGGKLVEQALDPSLSLPEVRQHNIPPRPQSFQEVADCLALLA
eukprot:548476-Hanusia_phi.AAC.1